MSRQSVIDTTASQQGIAEYPDHSNKTSYGESYGTNGVKWSAIFVSWVSNKSGSPLERITSDKGFDNCNCAHQLWQDNGNIVKHSQPGDNVLDTVTSCNLTTENVGIFAGWQTVG